MIFFNSNASEEMNEKLKYLVKSSMYHSKSDMSTGTGGVTLQVAGAAGSCSIAGHEQERMKTWS